MITEKDKKTIHAISGKYHVKRVILFGSNIRGGGKTRDIDIGIEGISPADFFRYYGELICALSKPVDVVDLSGTSKFVELVREEGVPIYG